MQGHIGAEKQRLEFPFSPFFSGQLHRLEAVELVTYKAALELFGRQPEEISEIDDLRSGVDQDQICAGKRQPVDPLQQSGLPRTGTNLLTVDDDGVVQRNKGDQDQQTPPEQVQQASQHHIDVPGIADDHARVLFASPVAPDQAQVAAQRLHPEAEQETTLRLAEGYVQKAFPEFLTAFLYFRTCIF